MKKTNLVVYVLLIITFSVFIQFSFAQETIQVLVGQQQTIDIVGATDVYVGDSNIAYVSIHRNQRQAIITGKAKGITSLTIVYSSGARKEKQVQVVTRLPQLVINEIRQLFGEIEGVSFKKVGYRTVATGEVLSFSDQKILNQIFEFYPEVVNLVTDRTEVPMIGIAVSIVEVSRVNLTDYNPAQFSAGVLVATDDGSVSGSNIKGTIKPANMLSPLWYWGASTEVFSKLAYWITKGHARMIANPTFAVSDGDSATFHSGGEVPFSYHTRDGLAVEWKEYGIKINVKPKLLGSGSVLLKLDAEASNLDRSFRSETGLPAIITRHITNNVTVKRGNTAVLAGMYIQQETESVKRVPVLGHLLPFFFSSVNKNREEKEIMILVTPTAPVQIEQSEYPMIQKDPEYNKHK